MLRESESATETLVAKIQALSAVNTSIVERIRGTALIPSPPTFSISVVNKPNRSGLDDWQVALTTAYPSQPAAPFLASWRLPAGTLKAPRKDVFNDKLADLAKSHSLEEVSSLNKRLAEVAIKYELFEDKAVNLLQDFLGNLERVQVALGELERLMQPPDESDLQEAQRIADEANDALTRLSGWRELTAQKSRKHTHRHQGQGPQLGLLFHIIEAEQAQRGMHLYCRENGRKYHGIAIAWADVTRHNLPLKAPHQSEQDVVVVRQTEQGLALCTLDGFAGPHSLRLAKYGATRVERAIKKPGTCFCETVDEPDQVVARAIAEYSESAEAWATAKHDAHFAFFCSTGKLSSLI